MVMKITEILLEVKRIPRKKGQKRKSKKHSDLYTDEDPKGTIHGLGFKDEATARSSITKIRKSGRSHAHKIQAAVAMEQRAKAAGKAGPAAVYRKFINSMKKKTKKKNEAALAIRQLAVSRYGYCAHMLTPINKDFARWWLSQEYQKLKQI